MLIDPGYLMGVGFEFVLWVALSIIPMIGSLYGFYFLISLPLRRQERARFFVDLLQRGLRDGKTVEQVVIETASCRDGSLGTRFHLLSARLRKGESFKEALDHTPHFIPAQVKAILETGIDLGDVEKVLPAMLRLLRDAGSKMKSSVNYAVLLLFSFTPTLVVVMSVIGVFILPRFLNIWEDMDAGDEGTGPIIFLTDHSFLINTVCGLITLFIAVVLLLYVSGERSRKWMDFFGVSISARLDRLLPWKHRRLKRDFSTMLALLLDVELPEDRAVELAARSTSNSEFEKRGAAVVGHLKKGEKLTEAIRFIDDDGEFRWRLENARHDQRGFDRALNGWHEYLDAKAFQLEQAAAQTISTSIVLAHGVIVGLFAIGVFYFLISIIEHAAL